MKRNSIVLIAMVLVVIGFAACNKSGNAIKSMQNMEIIINNADRFEIISESATASGNPNLTVDMPGKESLSLNEYMETAFTDCKWSYSEDDQNGELVTFNGNLKLDNSAYYYIWSVDSKTKMYSNRALGDDSGTLSDKPKSVDRIYSFYWSYFYAKYGTKLTDTEKFRKEQIATSAVVKMLGSGVW